MLDAAWCDVGRVHEKGDALGHLLKWVRLLPSVPLRMWQPVVRAVRREWACPLEQMAILRRKKGLDAPGRVGRGGGWRCLSSDGCVLLRGPR